ncbi:hypothetical protein [Salinispora pacifica]|uniref:hypothetical protein n=1 Tax=Salinispora pacifica TaxID=351187 RepID=UPI00039C6877|nr:hypothetical protein [Salinispora pacifica]
MERGRLDTWAFEELLRGALELFRGPVLDNIGSPVLRVAALEWEHSPPAAPSPTPPKPDTALNPAKSAPCRSATTRWPKRR